MVFCRYAAIRRSGNLVKVTGRGFAQSGEDAVFQMRSRGVDFDGLVVQAPTRADALAAWLNRRGIR